MSFHSPMRHSFVSASLLSAIALTYALLIYVSSLRYLRTSLAPALKSSTWQHGHLHPKSCTRATTCSEPALRPVAHGPSALLPRAREAPPPGLSKLTACGRSWGTCEKLAPAQRAILLVMIRRYLVSRTVCVIILPSCRMNSELSLSIL